MKANKETSLSISIAQWIIGGLVIAICALAGLYLNSILQAQANTNTSQDDRISSLEVESGKTSSDISSMKNDISWIKGSLQAKGYAPRVLDMATTTTLTQK